MAFAGCQGAAPGSHEPTAASAPVAATPPPVSSPASVAPSAPGSVAVAPPAVSSPVSDTACTDCHPDQVAGFRRTGMGRALAPVSPPPSDEELPRGDITHAPTGLIYRTFRDEAGRLWQEERLPGTGYTRRVEATHRIGSGNHTVSYLGTVDGQLVELPLTWYSERRLWDLSPGYQVPDQPRFSRVVEAGCLFCHNDLTPARDDRVATYSQPLAHGISCARCHGDPAAHLAAPGLGTILNPAALSPERQLQICQQCHLQAETSVLAPGRRWDAFDPVEPLDTYLSVYAFAGPDGESFTIAGHARRLAVSRCASRSPAALVCTRCHDPHLEASSDKYRAVCVSCHGGLPRSGPHCAALAGRAKGADCVPCHMKRGPTSDIPHVRFTDHFIRRRPGSAPPATPSGPRRLVDLVAGAADPQTPGARVREALAMLDLWERHGRAELRDPGAEALAQALAQAQPGVPRNAEPLAALARARAAQGRWSESFAAFEQARALGIRDPLFVLDFAHALNAGGRGGEAEGLLVAAAATREDPAVWLKLAELRRARRDGSGAALALAAAEKLTPESAAVSRERALQAEPANLLATATEAWHRDPLHVDTAIRLAALQLKAGNAAAARDVAGVASRADPRSAAAAFLAGNALALSGDWEASLKELGRAVELSGDTVAFHVALGETANRLGRPEVAQSALRRALTRFPGHAGLRQLAEPR